MVAWSAIHVGDIEMECELYAGLEEIEVEVEKNPTCLEGVIVPESSAEIAKETTLPLATYAFTLSSPVSEKCQWDLYDSGASHHMSPC